MEADGRTHLFRPKLLYKGGLTLLYRHHISCDCADIRRNHAITTHVIDIYNCFNHASLTHHVLSFVVVTLTISYNSVTKVKKKQLANDSDSC